jgi:integrase
MSKTAGSGCGFEDFLRQVEKFSNSMSKNELEEVRAVVHKEHSRRFKQRKEPKYGTTNKAFTELELQHFLRNVKNEKFSLLFRYQAFLGLRVGEGCKLHVSNIDFDKRELTLKSEKSGRLDSLLVPQELFRDTVDFIDRHIGPIKSSGGYIFFKENDNNKNGIPHVEVNYVRKVFRETIRHAELNQVYDYSEETTVAHKPRPLYRLTTHSLRHYAITHFAKSTNGNIVLSSRFARHSNPSTTMRYISKDLAELYHNIDMAFDKSKISNIKSVLSTSSR